MSQDILPIVLKAFQSAIQRDLPAFQSQITPDCVWASTYPAHSPFSGEARGPEAVSAILSRMIEPFEILEAAPRHTVVQGETVVLVIEEKLRVKATGKTATNLAALVMTVRDGKVASILALPDTFAVMESLRPDEAPKRAGPARKKNAVKNALKAATRGKKTPTRKNTVKAAKKGKAGARKSTARARG
jgi:ketosteroid isomerase-like protein